MKKYAILLAFIWPLTLSAATYFASPTGGGDGSSQTSPTTFTAGLKKLKNPGDTLYLLSGQYDLGNTAVQNLNGSSTNRIVISGYEGINAKGSYDAILDFRSVPYGTRGLQVKSTTSYLHIKNLTLRYSGKNNLYNEGSYNLFENLDIYGSADTGCQMKNGGNNIIKNVDSHDNFDYQTMSGTQANFGGNADGFADKQFEGAGNHYIGCRAWNNSDDGWDFFQRKSSSQTIIEGCICYQNGAPYYNMKDHPRYATDKSWFDSKVGTQMTDRYDKTITITLENYPNQGNGNGFKMGGGGTNHNILIHHSLSIGNYARGFDQNNNDGSMEVYNNTSYDNNVNFGFTTKYGTLSIRNCISLQSQKSDSYKSKTVEQNDYNSWSSGFSVSKADFRSTDTTQIRKPRSSDGALYEGSCLHLVSGSALIDAGVKVGLAYNGEAPDLGCYETDGEHHDPDPEPEPDEDPKPADKYGVAYVTIFDSDEDQALLAHLFKNDSLWVIQTNAQVPDIDYSMYDIIVISSKPNSGAAGLAALKGYNKPMVILKPFLFKPNAWNWGTAINTSDLSVKVNDTNHPLFQNLTFTDGELHLFSQCNQNAVTAISEWTYDGTVQTLGTPLSDPSASSIAILSDNIIMIGVSEYSTAFLTQDGLQLIENAILYLLGITMPAGIEQIVNSQSSNRKYIYEGQLFIQSGDAVYDATGRRIAM